jgi:peptide/nickel transport system ATP-binding protein
MTDAPLLSIERLNVYLGAGKREVQVLRDLSFSIAAGEMVGVVGESGCGKTMTGLAILGLLPFGAARCEGHVVFDDHDLLALDERAMTEIRGRRIAMIFQDPASALDPVFTVGYQIAETIRAHFRVGIAEARERAIDALAKVGIPAPRQRYRDYPHQFSGGMRQRVMIAIALSCEPSLLIADEPTTALDVTVQAQIIDLLLARASESGTSLLFITHDLGVLAQACTRILTMYAGELVEDGAIDAVLAEPKHPYTAGLLRSLPRLSPAKSILPAIPGRVLAPDEVGDGCRFARRCSYALDPCERRQTLLPLDHRHVRCWRSRDLALPGARA